MNNQEKLGFNIILLGLVSLITDASSEIIIPLIPFFLKFLGGAAIGVGLIIGIVGGLRDSLSSILKGASGYWSDKINRKKPFVVAGYSISAGSKLFFPLAETWEQVTIINVIERAGKGIRNAPRDAIIAESSEKKKGKGFGIHRAMDSAGAIIGSFFAFIFILIFHPETGVEKLDVMRWIFLGAAIIAFFALIPLMYVKEKSQRAPLKYKIGFKRLPREYYFVLCIMGLFAFGNFTNLFSIIYVGSCFPPELELLIPLILYIWFNVVYTIFSIPVGNLADKYGKGKILSFGYGFFSLTCLIFIFSRSLLPFILAFAIYGISYAFIDAVQRAYIADLVPTEVRGAALGTFHMVIGLAALPAGILAGILYDLDPTHTSTFLYGMIIGLISVIFLVIYIKTYKPLAYNL